MENSRTIIYRSVGSKTLYINDLKLLDWQGSSLEGGDVDYLGWTSRLQEAYGMKQAIGLED